MIALFIGPDDSETCNGCSDAVDGNPYTTDTVPDPGDFECMNNCRHMVQLSEDAPDDIAPYQWSANISFEEVPEDAVAIELTDNAVVNQFDADAADALGEEDLFASGDPDDIAQFLFDNSLLPDDVDLGLSDELLSSVTDAFDALIDDAVNPDFIMQSLADGDVEFIEGLMDNSPELSDMLEQMAANGFDSDQEQEAFALASVLDRKAELNDDGRWYVN
jgi:hypothetical protein